MGNETKGNGASSLGGGGGGFRAKMEHYVYSGEKKHVLAGIGIFTDQTTIGLTKITWKRLIKLEKLVSLHLHLHPLTSSPFSDSSQIHAVNDRSHSLSVF
ncbi:unnamed protein product, partial [Brassica rapa subsp. narinosa]